MITVKLTCPDWPIARQTPSQQGIWGNYTFILNQEKKECDYWVVFEGLPKGESAYCPRENTILITAEPPTLKQYRPEFLKQFALVITCRTDLKHPQTIIDQPGLPWHVGRRQKNHVNLSWSKDYDELSAITHYDKTKKLSVISSTKAFSDGHRLRLDFVSALQNHFGDRIDVFGRGIREIEDKWDALAPYKYHIAIENCAVTDYWTEKISDPFLADCHPIYAGCPNIEKYFTPKALTRIDLLQPEKAIAIIEDCLESNHYEQSRKEIQESRDAVLNRYNIFPMIVSHIDRLTRQGHGKGKRSRIHLIPETSGTFMDYCLRGLRTISSRKS
jgi:hypothetical protein